jgi:hypothetical protein
MEKARLLCRAFSIANTRVLTAYACSFAQMGV